jgi:hypothetical protein
MQDERRRLREWDVERIGRVAAQTQLVDLAGLPRRAAD